MFIFFFFRRNPKQTLENIRMATIRNNKISNIYVIESKNLYLKMITKSTHRSRYILILWKRKKNLTWNRNETQTHVYMNMKKKLQYDLWYVHIKRNILYETTNLRINYVKYFLWLIAHKQNTTHTHTLSPPAPTRHPSSFVTK